VVSGSSSGGHARQTRKWRLVLGAFRTLTTDHQLVFAASWSARDARGRKTVGRLPNLHRFHGVLDGEVVGSSDAGEVEP